MNSRERLAIRRTSSGPASSDTSTDRNPARSSRIIVVGTSANSQGSRQPPKCAAKAGVLHQGRRPGSNRAIAGWARRRTAATKRPPGASARVHAREHRLVIRHPVQGRGAEYGVERIGERQRRAVGQHVTRGRLGSVEASCSGVIGGRLAVRPAASRSIASERSTPTTCPCPIVLEQHGRQPGGAASEIEDALTWLGRQTAA